MPTESKMHPHYNEDEAKITLEQLASTQPDPARDRRLATFVKTSEWERQLSIVSFAKPKTWRLMEVDKEGAVTDWEFVFTIQGAVDDADLPPYTGTLSRDPLKWRQKYIKQSIKIDGLNTMMFSSALGTMQAIHVLFDDYFGEGHLQGLEHNDRAVLFASNRYFTYKRDVGQATQVAFSDGVDPNGILRRMAGTDYIHTDENEVKYYKLTLASDGTKRHLKVTPQSFRAGDLVELEVSFMAVPLAGEGQKVKMMTVLRSITLLDKQFRIQAPLGENRPKEGGKVAAIKRRIGYETEAEQGRTPMDQSLDWDWLNSLGDSRDGRDIAPVI